MPGATSRNRDASWIDGESHADFQLPGSFGPGTRWSWVLLAAILALTGCGGETGRGREAPPNLLLITIDTARADYIGCYGMQDAQTPHMDALAAAGIQFLRNISTSQCTNPSHASILTGLYLARHTVYDNETPLPESSKTIAEICQAAGYHTLGAVSARHLNPGNSNFGQGLDTFLTCEPVELKAGERNETFLRELRRVAAKPPFFAWVHYFDPHGHYTPPAPYDTLHAVGDVHEPLPPRKSMEIGPAKQRDLIDPDEFIALYKGEISYLDSEIGKVLTVLDGLGVADDTIVVLVSDHGESMTEKDIYFCHAGMYNQVLHVPLIMRWPGHIPAGSRVKSVTSSVDVFPTLLSLMSLSDVELDISGKSMEPVFEHPEAIVHEAVFSEAVRGVIRSVHYKGYKYMKPYPSDWALKEARLYRPFEDYWEEKDLIDHEAGRAGQLETLLDNWLTAAQGKALPAVEDHELDAKTKEALKSLGYVN
jgi:arylsulfatase A-like enzyme